MRLFPLQKELRKQGSPPPSLSAFFVAAKCSTPPNMHCCPGTSKYIFTTPVWLEWMQQDKFRLLVLTGPLGSGKTGHCISILKELSAVRSRMICSCFFNAASAGSNTVYGFLTSIISQLWSAVCESAKDQLTPRFRSYLKNYESVVDCPNDALVEIVQELISVVKPYAILIDGVDECDSEQNSVVEALHQIVTRKPLAAIAACRGFGPFAHLPYALRFELEPALLRNDLRAVIHHDLLIKLKLQGFGHEGFREEVGRFILKNAQDNFLHTRLLIEIMSTKRTQNQVKRVMEDFSFKPLPDLSARYGLINAMIESELSADDLPRRAQLLQMVVWAMKPLTLDEINELWAIDIQTSSRDDGELSSDIRREVEDLGQSFLQIGPSGEVTFYHTAARDFFRDHRLMAPDPHLYLARKCVAVLSQPRYKDANRAAELLKKHIVEGTKYGSDFDNALSELPLYEYAVRHFHEHVIEVSTPPKDFIRQLTRFLQGVEFVCWSEALFDLQSGDSFNSHIIVFRALLRWVKGLSAEDQKEIAINSYFELPYVLLADVLKERVDDLTLQYLPRIRVGEFLNSTSQRQEDRCKAVNNKEIVVAGLSKILDRKDRLLLKARAALYQEYFWQKKFEQAREDLLDLYNLQLDVIGDFQEDAYETAWLLGYAYIALGEFEEAGKLLQNAADQVRKRYGEEYLLFLLLYFLEGERLDAIQALDDARAHYEAVHKTLLQLLGSKNGFTLMVKTALGALLRKQRQNAVEAEDLLLTGYAERELIFTKDINVNVDAAMQLALFYRDRGAGEKCRELLDSVSDSEVFQLDFERYCQQMHLRALVAFDSGEYEDPKRSLLSLIETACGADRDKNNRELLWVRIDLADVMREHDHEDEAIMLFADLVCRRTEGEEELRDEPEPVSQLKIAEKALRLVRSAQYSESRRLLEENALEWVREADFWILTQGGPVLDTAIIEPIRSRCADQVGGG